MYDEYGNKYHEYLAVLAEKYAMGGEPDKTIGIYTEEIQDIVGTEGNVHSLSYDRFPAVAVISDYYLSDSLYGCCLIHKIFYQISII